MFTSKMKLTLLVLMLVLAALVALGGASYVRASASPQADLAPCSSPPPPVRTITVVGQGSVFMQPDVAHTLIGVQVSDPDIKTAGQKAQKTIEAVKKALIAQGVAEKDIQTADYSIHMQDDEVRAMMRAQGTKPKSPSGYVVRAAISVNIRDVDKVGDVMAAAIEAGANDIYGISFSAENPDKVMAEARAKAAADARARAQELAALHGVDVGDVISISEVINGAPPMFIEKSVGLGGGGGFAPGQLQVSARLQVVYAIRSQSDASSGEASEIAPPAPVTEEEPPAANDEDAGQGAPATPGAGSAAEVTRVVVSGGPELQGDARLLTIVGDDPELLRRFVSAWFATETSPFAPQETNPKLLLGKLPKDLPLPAKAFAGFDVLGALEQGGELGETILLASNEKAESALATLDQRLLDAGLTKPLNALGLEGGFGFDAAQAPDIYCNEKDGSWLMLSGNALADDGTVVRMEIYRGDEMQPDSPCNTPALDETPPEFQLLPPLKAPANARVMSEGAGGGPGNFYQSATVSTSLNLRKLDDHYQQQLQDAGWELLGSDRTKALAWSEWELKDKKGRSWIGSLLIAKRFSQEDSYLMMLRVERAAETNKP